MLALVCTIGGVVLVGGVAYHVMSGDEPSHRPVNQQEMVQQPVAQEMVQRPVVQEMVQQPVVQEMVQHPVVQGRPIAQTGALAAL